MNISFDYLMQYTNIPIWRRDEHYKSDSLITLSTIPREPFLNMKLALKLGIIFLMDLEGNATFTNENDIFRG